MVSRFSQVFAPPVFEDEEETRVARLLNIILFGTLAVTVLVIFLQPLYSPEPIPRLIFISMFALLEIGGLLMIRRGRVAQVVTLVPAAMWLLLTIITFFAGGVQTTSFTSYTIVIVIASLLGGGRVGIGYAAISVFAGLGFLLGELNGILPAVVIPTTSVSFWAGLTVNFLIAGLLLHLATNSISEALHRARQNEVELQRSNQQVRAQFAELEQLYQSAPIGMTLVDTDFRFLRINEQMAAIHGIPIQAHLGQKIQDVLPELADRIQPNFSQVLDTGKPKLNIEVRGTAQPDSGKQPVWLANYYPLVSGSGETLGVTTIFQDITERVQAEEALQRSADRLSTLHKIDQAILAAESVEEIVSAALQNLQKLIPGDQYTVTLIDQENETIRIIGNVDGLDLPYRGEKVLSLDPRLPLDIMRRGKMLNIMDPATGISTVPAILQDAKFKSGYMTPILSKNVLIGTINMASAQPNAFSPEHLIIAQEVANSLGVALQSARLFSALQRYSEQLETLRKASLKLTSDLALRPVINGVLEYALALTDADDAHIFLYDESKGHLTFGAAHWAGDNQENPYAELRPEGLTYNVARSSQRIVVPDVNSHPLFKDWPWGGAIIGLPLLHGKRVNGVMTVAFEKPHIFPDDEIRVLELLADQAAIAIHNVQLFNSERRQTQRLAALHQIGLALSVELELDSLLLIIVQQAIDLVGGSSGGMYLHEPEEDLLVWRVFSGENLAPMDSTLNKGEGLSGLAWETGQLVNIRDYEQWEGKASIYKGFSWRSVIGVPISRGAQFFGVLNILADKPDVFSDSDANLLSLFAAQAAIAIENARLFQNVTEQGAKLRNLSAQFASLEEEQRKQLSQELHDRVGQNLTALSINLNMAKSLLPAEIAAVLGPRLDDSQQLVEETAQQIRDVMAELRPPVLDDYGLLAALRWYCDRFATRTGIEVLFEGQEVTPRLPLKAETALFRISQEALINISRHADARFVRLSLDSSATDVRLAIADKGAGFDPNSPEKNSGWGLRIMRERIESVKGTLKIESTPGHGTRIVVQLPR